MTQNLVIAIAVVVISLCSFTYITIQEILKFKLKKEQIKADAMVQAENVKAKNQMDLELLLHSEAEERRKSVKTSEAYAGQEDDLLNERRGRINERL